MTHRNAIWGALGLFAGGAVMGVLFAPAKGKDTRKRIADTTADYAEDIKDRVDDLMANITDTIDIVKDETEKLTKKLKR